MKSRLRSQLASNQSKSQSNSTTKTQQQQEQPPQPEKQKRKTSKSKQKKKQESQQQQQQSETQQSEPQQQLESSKRYEPSLYMQRELDEEYQKPQSYTVTLGEVYESKSQEKQEKKDKGTRAVILPKMPCVFRLKDLGVRVKLRGERIEIEIDGRNVKPNEVPKEKRLEVLREFQVLFNHQIE